MKFNQIKPIEIVADYKNIETFLVKGKIKAMIHKGFSAKNSFRNLENKRRNILIKVKANQKNIKVIMKAEVLEKKIVLQTKKRIL